MTAIMNLTLPDELLELLRSGESVTIELAGPEGFANAPKNARVGLVRTGTRSFREGSLPSRVLAWARERGSPFGCRDVEEAFGLSRAHASMVLSGLARDAGLERPSRGVYVHAALQKRRK
jgi:hypothetical protein